MGFKTPAVGEIFPDALVIDNSVIMRWLFDDGSKADKQYARRTLDQIESESLTVLVPYIWVYEAAFVVGYYTSQGDIEYEQCASHLTSLEDLCTVIVGKESPSALFDFACSFKISAYDAAYLMLAKQLGCQIATLDKKMIKAARQASLTVLRA